MRLFHWKEMSHRYPVIVLILLFASSVSLTGCRRKIAPGSSMPMPSTSAPSNYVSTSGHLTISFSHPWRMGQGNSVRVNVSEVDEPLILAVELMPQFAGESASQKPVTLDGTPVAGHFKEITGYLVLYRADPDANSIQIAYPATLFDPALHDIGRELLGWELQVVLTSRIDAYPVCSGMSLGKRYPITTRDIQAQQTWIETEAESRAQVGPSTDARLVVPNSTSGVFLYHPLDAIVDSIILTSDLTFDFKLRNTTFSEKPGF